MRAKGISFQIVECWARSFAIKPVTPRIRRMLAILLPTTFPRATSADHRNAATILTTNSGSDVPKATTVRPTMRGDTPHR